MIVIKKILLNHFNLFFIVLSIFLIIVSCDKEVSHSLVEPEPYKGFIYVTSEPLGFTIFQNGRNTGRITPDSLRYLDLGDYSITLKRDYYKDTTVTLGLSEDETIHIHINLLSNPSIYGNLYFNSDPKGADIILNDSLINQVTPYTLKGLLPGKYSVRYKLFNHRDGILTATVRSSKTQINSVVLRDTSVWVDYQTSNSSIQSDFISAIVIDNDNVKWIGSLDKGLISYNEVSFTNYDKNNSSIPDDRINCIRVDHQNRIWVGTNSGIGVYNGSTWITYNKENSLLASNRIIQIHFDIRGSAWIATPVNLTKFDGVNWTIYNDSVISDGITDFDLDNSDSIWIATNRFGIYRLSNEGFRSLPKPDYNYLTYSVLCVTVDNSDIAWFGFNTDSSGIGGLSYWDGVGFNSIYVGNSGNKINEITVDQENTKWLSTTQGLVRFSNPNSLEYFNISNSFVSSDQVTGSVRSQSGTIWVTTFVGGLNKYKP